MAVKPWLNKLAKDPPGYFSRLKMDKQAVCLDLVFKFIRKIQQYEQPAEL